MGGFGVWDCLTRFPERFAAAIPMCGGGDEATVTPAVARVPLWTFHSVDDGAVKVKRTRNMIQALRQLGGHPIYFEYIGKGHWVWSTAYAQPELFPWLFAQRLGQPDTFPLQAKAPELPEVVHFPAETEFPAEGPLRNANWFQQVWCERRIVFWNNREKDKDSVVFLGDSITQGWKSLATDFPQLKIANRGIGGDITRGVLYRLKADVLDLNPQAVVLLIGTNDLEDNGQPEQIAQNIRAILAACKMHNPKMPVVVCKVMPSHASKNRPEDKIQKTNALIEEIVKSDPLFTCCDTWSIFADADGNAQSQEFPDLLHPNATGYSKLADALRPIFDKMNLHH
jgi:lysophospholipase L1-like esterase